MYDRVHGCLGAVYTAVTRLCEGREHGRYTAVYGREHGRVRAMYTYAQLCNVYTTRVHDRVCTRLVYTAVYVCTSRVHGRVHRRITCTLPLRACACHEHRRVHGRVRGFVHGPRTGVHDPYAAVAMYGP